MARVDIPADTPSIYGICEWCGRKRTVYAFAMWICASCLAVDQAKGGATDASG